jgi:hypothetical protein
MAKKRFSSGKKLALGKPTSEKGLLRQSSQWPLLECLISAEWQDSMQLTQICVARKSPSGAIAAGLFLLDKACLGAKNGYGRIFASRREYQAQLRNSLMESQKMTTCDVDMAAKIIEEAIDYAERIGFKPHKDTKQAFLVLGETHPEKYADLEVPVGGKEGKPFFVSGPHDDANHIIRILNRKVGEGNYNYLLAIGPPDFFDDEDWDEDWDDDEILEIE